MTIWRRWIPGGAFAPVRDLAGRFVSGGASNPPPSSVRAAILAGSCDDIVGGDDASESFRAEFLISARIATFRCALSKTLRGKRSGAKGFCAKDVRKGGVSPRVKSAPLSEGASSSVTNLPAWRGFLFASPLFPRNPFRQLPHLS